MPGSRFSPNRSSGSWITWCPGAERRHDGLLVACGGREVSSVGRHCRPSLVTVSGGDGRSEGSVAAQRGSFLRSEVASGRHLPPLD